MLKAQAAVQGDRAGVSAVTDYGKHLPPWTGFASCYERLEQGRSNAAAVESFCHID
jgi:hypothetical protein